MERLLSDEDLAFAIDNVFLHIISDTLAHAEVLHCLRNGEPQLLGHPEEMIHRVPTGKNDRCVVQYAYALLTERLAINGLHFNERSKIDLQPVLAGKLVVRRLFVSRSRLGYKNGLDLQGRELRG